MEHGEIEKICFDFVNNELISKIRFCYACSLEDEDTVETAFKTAIPNPVWNKFPDFLFDGGFIEHFEVTSSHSNRNGSTMKRELNKLHKEAEMRENALKAEMNETPCYEGKSITTDTWHSKHTYDDFYISFKRNWQHHIESLDKYEGNKSTGIFMIQYNDSALVMHPVYPDIKTGLYYGDLLKRLDYIGYRLTHDSNILEYIYTFKEKIQFVAFFNNDHFHGKSCEIICVENIPEILKIVKGKYRFRCATVGTSHIIHGISYKNPFYKGNEEDE